MQELFINIYYCQEFMLNIDGSVSLKFSFYMLSQISKARRPPRVGENEFDNDKIMIITT